VLEHFRTSAFLPPPEIARFRTQERQFQRRSIGLLLDERIEIADVRIDLRCTRESLRFGRCRPESLRRECFSAREN